MQAPYYVVTCDLPGCAMEGTIFGKKCIEQKKIVF
jgi:hypothetical protein